MECDDCAYLLKSISEASDFVLDHESVCQDHNKGKTSGFFAYCFLSNFPEIIIAQHHQREVSDIGAHQNERLVVYLQEFKDKQRPTEVHWIKRVPNSIRVSPLPWEVHTSIDYVVSNLSTLIQLIRVDKHLGESQGAE